MFTYYVMVHTTPFPAAQQASVGQHETNRVMGVIMSCVNVHRNKSMLRVCIKHSFFRDVGECSLEAILSESASHT